MHLGELAMRLPLQLARASHLLELARSSNLLEPPTKRDTIEDVLEVINKPLYRIDCIFDRLDHSFHRVLDRLQVEKTGGQAVWRTPAPLSTAEGCGSRACTAGLFSQKSEIASPMPDPSTWTSDTVKQTDNVVSACATHWTTHAGWLTSDRDSVRAYN